MKNKNRWDIVWAFAVFWVVGMLARALAQESYIPVLNPIHTQAGRALQPGMVSTGNIDATTSTVTAATVLAGTANAQTVNVSGTLTMTGSVANVALGSNYLSGDGGDEGVYVTSNGTVLIGNTTAGGLGKFELYGGSDANLVVNSNWYPCLILDNARAAGGHRWFLQAIGGGGDVGGFRIYDASGVGDVVKLEADGDAWFYDDVSAASFTDRTPAFKGDALKEISSIKADEKGNIDHTTLGAARVVRSVIKSYVEVKSKDKPVKRIEGSIVNRETFLAGYGLDPDVELVEKKEVVQEEGRSLGMAISRLEQAIVELNAKIEALEKR